MERKRERERERERERKRETLERETFTNRNTDAMHASPHKQWMSRDGRHDSASSTP